MALRPRERPDLMKISHQAETARGSSSFRELLLAHVTCGCKNLVSKGTRSHGEAVLCDLDARARARSEVYHQRRPILITRF